MLKNLLLVMIGGGAGSGLRFLTYHYCSRYFVGNFPVATFICNILGCIAIGVLSGWIARTAGGDSAMKWLLVTGFCGGYTTFSAFGIENFSLLQGNNIMTAIAYIAASVCFGILAVGLGLAIAR